MIFPPHLLKYQKQLQELNKHKEQIKDSTNPPSQLPKSKPKQEQGKNNTSNKFISNINSIKSTKKEINPIPPIENTHPQLELKEDSDTESEKDTPEKQQKEQEQSNDTKKNMKKGEMMEKNWRIFRKGAGMIWQDESLNEWPENDYRIFVGDLGNEVNDQVLANAFIKYPSFEKAKVIRNKVTGKTKGYGFISVTDVNDYIKIMREMNGKYVGNRPIRLKRSTWKDRSVKYSTSKMAEAVFIKKKRNKNEIINSPEITDMKLLKKDPTLGGLLTQNKKDEDDN